MKKLNSRAFEEYIENDGETCLVIFSRKSCHVCPVSYTHLDVYKRQYLAWAGTL